MTAPPAETGGGRAGVDGGAEDGWDEPRHAPFDQRAVEDDHDVSPVSGTSTSATNASGSTPIAPSTSGAPTTAPSLPGTGGNGSRPTSGGSASTPSLPTLSGGSTSTPTSGTVTVPDISSVTDTGTKAGDVVDQTVNTVTGALGGG